MIETVYNNNEKSANGSDQIAFKMQKIFVKLAK